MSSVWAPVVAALGASVLTGSLTFGVQFWDRRREAKAAREAARQAIYLRLLTVTAMLMAEFGYIQILNGAASRRLKAPGIAPGQQTLSEVLERLIGPMRQLGEVWAEAWLHFDAEVWIKAGAVQSGRVASSANPKKTRSVAPE